MARKLPWKRTSESSTSNTAGRTAAQSPREHPSGLRSTAQDDSRDILRTPVSRRYQRVLDSDPIRSPSTSPPPERPHEEFMILGPLNDDKYRMVDDEFLHIAQRFTAHLHRAEYDRLKALAKAQNAATIREIEWPVVVDAVPTMRARQRSDLAQRDMKQRKTLEGDGEARDDESVLPSLARTNLRGLMEAPRREGRIIMPSASASSSSSRTRAAAGYSSKSSPQRDHRSRARSPPTSMPSSSKRIKFEPPSHIRPSTTSRRTVLPNPHTSPQATSSSSTGTAHKKIPHSDRKNDDRQSIDGLDELDDDLFGLHKRMMNRKKSREQFKRPEVKQEAKQEPKTIDLGSIPSFL
ncbi:uncharacterized protein TrAFT101_000897 [Trichoderma asperellum]|uniref:uncharacterized protein n=1 Tax=Trichoderma asperellum TaxID=101201 RepID=UPI0033334CF5|nr:hypothetical protein TrAFT101_000897 [Trichoderma asperellum]